MLYLHKLDDAMEYFNNVLRKVGFLVLTAVHFLACRKTEKVVVAFSADRTEITVIATAGKETIQLSSSDAWTLSGLPDWITASPSSGTGNAAIGLTYNANSGSASRVANFNITSTSDQVSPIKIRLTQVGGEIAITNFNERARGGEEITLNGAGFSIVKTENRVTINNIIATVVDASATTLKVRMPIGAGDGPIAVEVAGRKAVSTGSITYVWTWIASTVAGDGTENIFHSPAGIALATDGSVFVADRDNHCVRKVVEQANGTIVTVFAGSEGKVSGNVDGAGTAARFVSPVDVSIDQNGILYVPDGNSVIRKITPNGNVSKVLNTTNAPLSIIALGIFSYGNGNLLVSDLNNNSIRHISSTGEITTLLNSANNLLPFNRPKGLVMGKNTPIHVCDSWNNRIQQITWDIHGVKSNITKAGSTTGVAGKADGNGINASFNMPSDLAIDGQGVMYVADQQNHLIRKIVTKGDGTAEVTTIAGTGIAGYKDGYGLDAQFNLPASIVVNNEGTVIYIADAANNRIRKLILQ